MIRQTDDKLVMRLIQPQGCSYWGSNRNRAEREKIWEIDPCAYQKLRLIFQGRFRPRRFRRCRSRRACGQRRFAVLTESLSLLCSHSHRPVVRKNVVGPRIRVNSHRLAAAVALPFSHDLGPSYSSLFFWLKHHPIICAIPLACGRGRHPCPPVGWCSGGPV